jgi:hypothetical protein
MDLCFGPIGMQRWADERRHEWAATDVATESLVGSRELATAVMIAAYRRGTG